MRSVFFAILLVFLVTAASWACGGSSHGTEHSGMSHHGAEAAGSYFVRAYHGGEVVAAADLRFEIVSAQNRIRIYGYDELGRPLDLEGAEGTVLLSPGGDEVSVPLAYVPDKRGRAGWLEARLPRRATRWKGAPGARISMRGLPSEIEPEIELVGALGRSVRPTGREETWREGHVH